MSFANHRLPFRFATRMTTPGNHEPTCQEQSGSPTDAEDSPEVSSDVDLKIEAWRELSRGRFPHHMRSDRFEATIQYLFNDIDSVIAQTKTEIGTALCNLSRFAMREHNKVLMSLLGAKLAELPVPEESMITIARDFASMQENSAHNSGHLSTWITWFSTRATDAVYDELMAGLAKRVERDEPNLEHIVAVFAQSDSPYAKKLWQEVMDVSSVAYPVNISDLPTKSLLTGLLEAAPGTVLVGMATPLVTSALLKRFDGILPMSIKVVLGCMLAAWFTLSYLNESAIRWYRSNNPTRPIPLAARLPEGNNESLAHVRERYERHIGSEKASQGPSDSDCLYPSIQCDFSI